MRDSNFGGKCSSLPYQAADAVHFAPVCGVYEGLQIMLQLFKIRVVSGVKHAFGFFLR